MCQGQRWAFTVPFEPEPILEADIDCGDSSTQTDLTRCAVSLVSSLVDSDSRKLHFVVFL